MTGFSADWLALRAPADDSARNEALVVQLCEWAAHRMAGRDGPLRIADYGGGTGAGLAALSSRLPGPQNWRILDHDADLLARIPAQDGVETVTADLAAAPEIGLAPLPDVVTGFAFFDLVSAPWIDRLVPLITATGAAVYAPLTYDGVETWKPAPPHEAEALTAFNRDMQRDKGFGPALGAGAAPYLASALRGAGYEVTMTPSPWRLSHLTDSGLMDALATGGASALADVMSDEHLAAWMAGRQAATEATVGHWDLLATPKQP